MNNKVKIAETREVKRSDIKLANYNPRKISKEARELLKKNIKRVGLLGGVVWNEYTGNLISGHQRVSVMDEINKYEEGNDYMVKVEVAYMSEKEEKEQNLFMNNRNVQGEFDNDMLRDMFKDIDYAVAGFSDFDMQMMGINIGEEEELNKAELEANTASGTWSVKTELGSEANELAVRANEATKNSEENRNIDRSQSFYNDTPENQIARHNEVAKIRERIANQADFNNDNGALSYVIVSFNNPQEKMDFCTNFGFDGWAKTIDGNELLDRIDG